MIDWLSLFVYSHISSTLSYAVCVRYVTAVVPDSLQPHGLACRAPLSMEFSRQEYWRGLPCPSLGDLPNPGVKPVSLSSCALAGTFCTPSTTAVLNLVCDSGKFLWALDIFKRFLTCVCVCVGTGHFQTFSDVCVGLGINPSGFKAHGFSRSCPGNDLRIRLLILSVVMCRPQG